MRIKGLDFLRGLAIILVLFRHGDLDTFLSKIGWIGVDLFFVISGFLVSGLLFQEYLQFNKVDIKRFLIRRGFKIYPSFYIFIIFSIAVHWLYAKSFYSWNEILAEVFYLQSYLPAMWTHTWSLAVEEHFYLALAGLIPLCILTNKLENKKFMLLFFFSLLVICFLMRYSISNANSNKIFFPFIATHLRMDGIVVGVICSYLYRFTGFNHQFIKTKIFFSILAVAFILPAFIFQAGSFFMNTIGLTSINIGFGILLLLFLDETQMAVAFQNKWFKIPVNIICFVGLHSYSIYLWHLFAKKIILLFNLNTEVFFISYFILALAIGITLSYLIEKPFLRYREKYFS